MNGTVTINLEDYENLMCDRRYLAELRNELKKAVQPNVNKDGKPTFDFSHLEEFALELYYDI